MALIKQGQILGFSTNVYSKITGVDVRESGKDDDGKLYTVNIIVNSYTDSTKQYDYKQEVYSFQDIRIDSLTVAGLYGLLKTKEEFMEWSDA